MQQTIQPKVEPTRENDDSYHCTVAGTEIKVLVVLYNAGSDKY